ncbi:ATP-dependent DNA helicase 2 subunit KU80 [Mercurialis annua]|uniref:ATP-dependent DNA helicase 2 subunit KU80 n=1 Tax=Mercurialis annua TaxID=3986 RepID=UPI0021609139|nr:ATP-dependent DNA helicase 2 subunit KU80 [Mercurialis annua]
MARNRESLILLLDVGPSMHYVLPAVERFCSMLVQKKLNYNKTDEVAIVLFGTEETDNELTIEVGGYEHIVVLRKMKVVDGDIVDALQNLPRGTVTGDYLDAIVVGMDMMIKKYQKTNKGKKRLCLITDAQNPIKDPYEGSKEDQVSTIATQMAAHGVKMETIVVRARWSNDTDQKFVNENDRLLHLFSEKISAKTVYVESPISLLGAVRTRRTTPVTIFRGDLEISPQLNIKVWVYKKTSEEKLPTLKKYSDKAPPTDKYATHEIKVDYEYKSTDDPNKVVPPDQRIKGFRYGPQVIPISSDELEAVKFKPEKSVKLLGFTDASNILRQYYMKDVNVFIPEPGNMRATVAVSALARAMKETSKVAIVRCVWKQGQRSVVVGVLTPNLSEKDKIPDSFFFNVLPFAEDVREFQFPSFSNFPAPWQPSEQQQAAADELVMALDLAPPGKEEILRPEFTPNPILERFYHHLEVKSKHPDAAVPPLDRTLKTITEPDPELILENKSVIDAFCKSFEVKQNPKLKKPSRRLLREKPSGSDDEMGLGDSSNALAIKHAESNVEQIGNSTPVQDFEAMMSRRDDPNWVSKAIKGMKEQIFSIVEKMHEDDDFTKTLECLVALRRGCILEQEPKEFNDLLRDLVKFCHEKKLDKFIEFLVSKELILIPKSESIDSEVTDDEARSFWVKKEPKFE